MGSKGSASIALFFTLNLLFFALVTACVPCGRKPPPPQAPAPVTSCPSDTLKLGVCANVLGGLVGVVVGSPPDTPCCTLLSGLADIEAAVCLCTAIKANILGINLNIPVSLSLLLNTCGKTLPKGFQCA